jgi:succinate-semialdehyde dehydrogenase/glutarate-semialdehyde dehydrogenase
MSTSHNTKTYQLFIDGKWTPSVTGETLDVMNPATGEVVAEIQLGNSEDVDQAVQAAHRAFDNWASVSAKERARLMHAAAARVREEVEPISRLLTAEMGKPLQDARKEVSHSAEVLDFFAEEGLRIEGEIAPVGLPAVTSLVVREPLGVCAAIAPWNYPVSLLAWKVGPALATGCTLVAKPASETPTAAMEYVRCIHEAGLPSGVINAVTGRGSVVGTALVEHPLVRKVAFTGTGEVGREIMARAAKTLKHISLELGGHSPLIVCADADFEAAVKEGVARSFRNMGQICNSVNRIYVEESIYEAYLERFVEETQKLTIGDGLKDPTVDLGPMLNQAGIDKTIRHVEDAVSKGARLLCGGEHPEGPEFKTRLFYRPTALAGCTPDMLVMQEETFGPVVGIAPFKDIDEAIRLANSTEFGLVSYAYTQSLASALALAHGIKSGTVCVNNIVGSTLEAPYPGWKSSGMGLELSRHALDEYLLVKHVRIEV